MGTLTCRMILDSHENKLLNQEFTEEECKLHLKKKPLKNKKASREDEVLNEYLKSSYDTLMPVYCKSFDLILKTGNFPSSWPTGTVIPIYETRVVGMVQTITGESYYCLASASCLPR